MMMPRDWKVRAGDEQKRRAKVRTVFMHARLLPTSARSR